MGEGRVFVKVAVSSDLQCFNTSIYYSLFIRYFKIKQAISCEQVSQTVKTNHIIFAPSISAHQHKMTTKNNYTNM